MKLIVLVAALAHVVTCGVQIRMPYLNPAGVTYVDGNYHTGLAAGPLSYYRSAPVVAHAPAAPVSYAAPVAYAAPAVKYAAVPTVHHVPGVADVPVTRYEAQPAVIQKVVDVAKPAVKTRKFEIRRPAIQKQFYDIEERIIVRPAGSALVELDEPVSKTQKGAALIHPAVPVAHVAPAVAHVAPVAPVARLQYAPTVVRTPYSAFTYAHAAPFPAYPVSYPQYGIPAQNISANPLPFPVQPQQPQQPQPQEPQQPQQPEQPEQPQFDNNDDSVSIDNPEFGARSAQPQPQPQPQQQFQPQPQEQQQSQSQPQPSASPAPESEQPQARSRPESRSLPSSPLIVNYPNSLDLIPQARAGANLVPSVRNLGPEISQANQQRLIQLLTARGGVAEVGFARSGPSVSPVGEAGQVRARVLSATPAPPQSEPTGERVNTRRVVVSRPIETLQEIEVAEPVTKLERIHVNHPTYIKTARQDLVRVPTSVPVYGKTLAPVAHAPVAVAPAYAHHVSYYG